MFSDFVGLLECFAPEEGEKKVDDMRPHSNVVSHVISRARGTNPYQNGQCASLS